LKNKLFITIFSILLVSLIAIQPALINAASSNSKANKIQGQYIVVLSDDSNLQSEVGKAKAKGAEILHVYEHSIKGFAIKVQNDQVLDLIKKNNPSISYIEPDYEVQAFAQTLPTGINRIDADLSSTTSGNGAGSVSVDIAIIDTGIDPKHPDLNVYRGVTICAGTGAPGGKDGNGHGTHVAGTAAAKDNGIGVVGVAPGARLWAVKVLDNSGSGTISCVIAGIEYVTNQKVDDKAVIEVANMSLGCECSSTSLDTAISNSVLAGVTYVVAAGNSGKDAATFSPANHPYVIAVSAIADSDGKCGGLGPLTSYGADDTFATFSNFGSKVDIAAPGVKIYSTYKSGTYATLSGTSMASPHVAGDAALYKANNPTATPAVVQGALETSGILQTKSCDTTLNNGDGGFTGDTDGSPEPLVYARNY